MSKLRACMQQVSEIATFVPTLPHLHKGKALRLLLCSMLMVDIVLSAACSPKSSTAISSGTPNGSEAATSSTRVLRRGLPGEPRTLDPQIADDDFSFQVIRDLYEGLTAEDRDGKIIPGTAKSWQVDPSGTRYEFVLRPDLKWSDGSRLTADDFVEALRRAVDPKSASGSAALLNVIKNATAVISGRMKPDNLGVSADGDSKVIITLEHPAPYVLQILAQPIAAPFHRFSQSILSEQQPSKQLFDGPYVLSHRYPGSSIELKRNPLYWNAQSVAIETVRYLTEDSQGTELREYLGGQLDMTFTIPASDLDRILATHANEVQTSNILWTLYLALNLTEPPLKGSRELRQALSMAVDREMIAKHVMPGVSPAFSFVAKGIADYDRPEYAWSTWNREKRVSYAKELFARSGYSAQRPLKLRMYFNNDEGVRRLMIAVAENWKKDLGVDPELVSDEFRVFLDGRRDKSRWEVARLGWSADYNDPQDFLENFATGNRQNDPGYDSESFNRLIDEARSEPINSKRLDLLRQSEVVLLGDYPIIPIYFYSARRLVKPYVGGAVLTPMNRTYTKDLYWRAATSH